MSLDRFLNEPNDGQGPRVPLAYAKKVGRPPSLKALDEKGAISVIDLMGCGVPSHEYCGGRFAYFRISGSEQCEVRHLRRLVP